MEEGGRGGGEGSTEVDLVVVVVVAVRRPSRERRTTKWCEKADCNDKRQARGLSSTFSSRVIAGTPNISTLLAALRCAVRAP